MKVDWHEIRRQVGHPSFLLRKNAFAKYNNIQCHEIVADAANNRVISLAIRAVFNTLCKRDRLGRSERSREASSAACLIHKKIIKKLDIRGVPLSRIQRGPTEGERPGEILQDKIQKDSERRTYETQE